MTKKTARTDPHYESTVRAYGSGSFWWSGYKRKDGTVARRAIGYLLASDGTKVHGTGKTKRAAEDRARKKLDAYERSLRAPCASETFDGFTVAEFAAHLHATKKRITESSVAKYNLYISYLRAPKLAIQAHGGRKTVIGDYLVKSVGTYELELLMEAVCERYAPKTAKEFRAWLMTQFRKAVNFGVRPDNAARELEPVYVPEPEPVDIPNWVLELLLEKATCPRMKAAVTLMLHGLRFGEVFGLTWDDFHGNVATIRRQLQPTRIAEGQRRELALVRRKRGGDSYEARFKDEEMKVLLASVELAQPVDIWIERKEGRLWTLERPSGVRVVVPGADGKPWPESTFRRHFAKLLERVSEASGIRPHALRAWMATSLLDMGVPLKHVQKGLGHSRPEATLRYQRPVKEWSRQAHDTITRFRKGELEQGH